MNRPQFLASLDREVFDLCYDRETQTQLRSLVELVGDVPSKRDYDRKWVLKNIKQVEGSITGWGSIPFDEEMLREARKLKILFHTAGTVRTLYEEAMTRNLRVVSNASLNAIPVAEFTLGVILNGLKGVYQHWQQLRRVGKAAWRTDIYTTAGYDICLGYYGTIVGVIGLGYIGHKLLELLRNFEFRVLVCSRHLKEDEARRLKVEKVDLDELMSRSDAVVLSAANLPQNRYLIDRQRLALLKDRALFINVARGALVDENALIEELKKGRITAFLDVTDPEPPPEGHPFYKLPNCILTPHIAGSFGTERHRLGKAVLQEIEQYLQGKPVQGELSVQELVWRA